MTPITKTQPEAVTSPISPATATLNHYEKRILEFVANPPPRDCTADCQSLRNIMTEFYNEYEWLRKEEGFIYHYRDVNNLVTNHNSEVLELKTEIEELKQAKKSMEEDLAILSDKLLKYKNLGHEILYATSEILRKYNGDIDE